MKAKHLWLMMIIGMMVLPMVIAVEDVETAIKPIEDVVGRVTFAISLIGGSIAGLILVIVGVMYALSKDPADREKYKQWLLAVLIGLVVILLAKPIVDVITGLVKP